MRTGTVTIAVVLAALLGAIALGVGVPFGPELLLLLVGVGIPGYVLYRVGEWLYRKLSTSGDDPAA
jgi:hypothetical protein